MPKGARVQIAKLSCLVSFPFPFLVSDQLVTLTTTTPHTSVRISTITLDHGLLRTIPVRSSSSSLYGYDEYSRVPLATMGRVGGGRMKDAEPEFIDLQPDGNSFDMMKGLIRSK
jgi:biotin--protein ligase